MHIKRYTIASILLFILIGWYVYAFVTQEHIGLSFMGIHLPSLPIAVWAVVPVFLLYLASVAHMGYYSFIGSFKLRKYQKDYEKLLDAVSDAYLGKAPRDRSFKTPRYELLGNLLSHSKIFPADKMEDISDEKILNVITAIETVKSGQVADLKKYNLDRENALLIQNQMNQFNAGDINAEDVLSRSERYSFELCQKAYATLAMTSPLYALEQYKQFMSKDALWTILGRVNADTETLEAPNDALIALINEASLTQEDYIKMSSVLSAQMLPEQRMKLFETLSEANEETMPAYLYTLFDLEMLSPADEILENSQPDEFIYFKAYRALKECNKHYSIEL
ncbi:MAG TPA: hypothetical protein ENK65_00770, partial [Helicobacteraceae bacterium]|nr:hypothetical protein [Helicobacteraceae bacterium]